MMSKLLIGIILLVLGLLLRWGAMRQLKKNFTLNLQAPGEIVTTGLYRFVRHPSYLGSLLALTGMALICIYLALVYLAWVFFLSRIIQEETIILHHHPAIYQDYCATTPMLLPKVSRGKKYSAVSRQQSA